MAHLDEYAPIMKYKEKQEGKKCKSARVRQLRRAMKNVKKEGRTEAYHRNQDRYRKEILKSRLLQESEDPRICFTRPRAEKMI